MNPKTEKTGDKLIIVEPAYATFNESRQTTYWNAKVQLSDGTQKTASLFESACDKFAKAWGTETSGWVGKTILVAIKSSKLGNDYIEMTPSTDKDVDVAPVNPQEDDDDGLETINADDIPY